MNEPRNSYRPKPSFFPARGQHRCDRHGKGTPVRPGSKSGAETQDGSPGDLRYPTGVHVKRPALRATGTQRPGREGTSNSSRSATANTKQEDHVGGGSEQNKRPPMRKWEVVAPSYDL